MAGMWSAVMTGDCGRIDIVQTFLGRESFDDCRVRDPPLARRFFILLTVL